MTKEEFIEILALNNYTINPLFGCYIKNNTQISFCFFIKGDKIVVGKVKWNNINLKEFKEVSLRSFNPDMYSLITPLKLKQRQLALKQNALIRQKNKELQSKGYKPIDFDNVSHETDLS
jgi:hypothetical protein